MKKNKHFNITRSLLLLTVMLFSITVNAQEEKMQTAFIYQLTRLIEWCPEGKEGNFVIAVVGDEPDLLAQLSALQVRRVGNQQIEVKSYSDVTEVGKTNILFVPKNLFEQITQITQKAEGACTLIISDEVGSARTGKGAGVTLIYDRREGKLEFHINRNYMRERSFTVNSKLYDLATRVY